MVLEAVCQLHGRLYVNVPTEISHSSSLVRGVDLEIHLSRLGMCSSASA